MRARVFFWEWHEIDDLGLVSHLSLGAARLGFFVLTP